MFLVKAGTVIQVTAPKSLTHFNWGSWIPYTTKQDRIYDKEDVWDVVAVMQDRGDIPPWAVHNILELGKVIIRAQGKHALVNPSDIQYLD
jgi:hypothetical protein